MTRSYGNQGVESRRKEGEAAASFEAALESQNDPGSEVSATPRWIASTTGEKEEVERQESRGFEG